MDSLETYDDYINEMAAKLRQKRRDTEPETPEQEAKRLARNAKFKQLRAEWKARQKEVETLHKTGEEVLPPVETPDPVSPEGKQDIEKRKKVPLPKKTPNEKLCRTIAGDFYWFLHNKSAQERIFIDDDFTFVTKEFRRLGAWGTPSDIFADTDEDEDNIDSDSDLQVWQPGQHERFLKLFREFVKGKDWEKLVTPILNIGESCWCYFTINIK